MAIVVLEIERSEKGLRKVEEERDRIIGRDRVEVGMNLAGIQRNHFSEAFDTLSCRCLSSFAGVENRMDVQQKIFQIVGQTRK